jgi:Kef-type K+ transport system membrane component KefB
VITPILAALVLVILGAKLGGWLSIRLGQPAVLGELLAGILIGPSLLGVFELPYFEQAHVTELLIELGEIGVILLMFVAGLEIHLEDMVKTGKPAILAGSLGVLVPIAFTVAVSLPLGYSVAQSMFLGLGVLRSREGIAMLGAAVVDDVLSLVGLSVFTALVLAGGTGALGLVGTILRMLLFLGVALLISIRFIPRVSELAHRVPVSERVVTMAILVMLVAAWSAEEIGSVAAITGAFIAGLGFSRSSDQEAIRRGMHVLAYSFFVPIFLVSIGLQANLRLLGSAAVVLVVILTAVAVVSKLIGAGVGAKMGGMSTIESFRIGAGMVSRGEVGLIIANVGLPLALITTEVFTGLVMVVLLSTLLAPPLLKLSFRGRKEATDGQADRLRTG